MKKLIQGIVEFRKSVSEETRELFSTLALGQKPDSLFIACSDSRVVPNQFVSTNPGDLFVVRNIGNLVPPSHAKLKDVSVPAALEFAILSLGISDIIVCGHSECGAIKAMINGTQAGCSLDSWIQYGKASLTRDDTGIDSKLTKENQISQSNVLQQMEHLSSYPFIQKRLDQKTVRIHGWWFDIAHADVYCYEESKKCFVLIDEAEANLILSRLQHN